MQFVGKSSGAGFVEACQQCSVQSAIATPFQELQFHEVLIILGGYRDPRHCVCVLLKQYPENLALLCVELLETVSHSARPGVLRLRHPQPASHRHSHREC